MHRQGMISAMLHGFWRAFVTSAKYVLMLINDQIQLLASSCVGIAHGVQLGLLIQKYTDVNLFPNYIRTQDTAEESLTAEQIAKSSGYLENEIFYRLLLDMSKVRNVCSSLLSTIWGRSQINDYI
jgi:hypothetical protein